MTCLIPPRGFSTSPSLRGMRWMWQWNIVCPAASPILTPTLNPATEASSSLIASFAQRRRSLQAFISEVPRSNHPETWRLGITRVWRGVTGYLSRRTKASSFCARVRSLGKSQNGHPSDLFSKNSLIDADSRRTEDPPIQVFAKARRQRCVFDESKRSPPVGQPFRTKEQGGAHLREVKPLRQIEQVGYVDHLDAGFQQGPDDLPRDLRTFSLVGRSERLVEQNDAVRGHVVDDRAHSAELFVQLPALHAGVFFPLVVRKDAIADIGTERLGRHEHAALHHQLGKSDASQERRLAAPVGAGDHHEQFIIGGHVVADDPLLHAQTQAEIV